MLYNKPPKNDIDSIESGKKIVVAKINAIEINSDGYVVFAIKAKGFLSPERYFFVSSHPDFCNVCDMDVIEIIKDTESGNVSQVNIMDW